MKKLYAFTAAFCGAQAVLYVLILTTSDNLLKYSSYAAVVLCFIHALFHFRNGNRWVIGGLLCTVCADFCLIMCNPIQRLYGMLFFLLAQILYAITLHRSDKRKVLHYIRYGLLVISQGITFFVLKDNIDLLAIVSMAYYANLISNILCLLWKPRAIPLFGFLLFLLCDTVIGLQIAAGTYLPIGQDSVLYKLLFCGFNLAWAFYLPSQVLLSLWAKRTTSTNK